MRCENGVEEVWRKFGGDVEEVWRGVEVCDVEKELSVVASHDDVESFRAGAGDVGASHSGR